MTERNAIEALWEEFQRASVPQHAAPAQRQAMYMSFLAGCDTILQLEETVRDRQVSHRQRTAFTTWRAWVTAELKRIAEPG